MNDQKKAPIVGTRVTFHVAFRNWQGRIDSYTPMGRAVVVTDEGRQFTLTLDQLTMMVDLAKQYTPADAGILAGKRDAAAFELDENVIVNLANMPAKVVMVSSDGATVNVVFGDGYEAYAVPAASVTRCADSPFKYGDTVEVAAVGVPAKVVGVSPDGQTLEVVYDDMVEIFKVPAAHTTRHADTPAGMAERIQKMETEMEDMRRQIADLIKERTTLRYAMRQIASYQGSRYTDDAEVMKEIAEAALDGENITPRR